MSHEKLYQNIYHDKRCTKFPYYVNIMRRGHRLYRKFVTIEEAVNAKNEFIEKHITIPTDHPILFERNGKIVLEISICKEYDNYEDAERKANLIMKFADEQIT